MFTGWERFDNNAGFKDKTFNNFIHLYFESIPIKSMKKHLLFLLFCISIGIHAETYNFARLDNSHGLSNNQVKER
jgi:hypothetical protein